MNADELRAWIGREEIRDDVATAAPLRGLAATLDRETPFEAGDEVPPLWHWTYFLPSPTTSQLGVDGHPKKGGFLPPIALPRRMWAGSRIQFLRPLRVGDAISRRSTVVDIVTKDGRTGPLYFVKVRHEVQTAGATAILEEQDIVYRQPPSAAASTTTPAKAPVDAIWRRRIEPSPVLLFRYSALTFNSHRIHFDRPYAEQEEGYRGLVVHGPLQAALMLNLASAKLGRVPARFDYRCVAPLFAGPSFGVGVDAVSATARIIRHDGTTTAEGRVPAQGT